MFFRIKPSSLIVSIIYLQILKSKKIIESADLFHEGSPARPVDSMREAGNK